MNDKQSELTSTLLDGELDPDAQQRAISAILGAGQQELDRFGRYRLMGDVMRGESFASASTVAERVHRALIDEPVVLAPPARPAKRWLRPVAGLAVAASVAMAAVLVAPQLMTQSGGHGGAVQVANVPQVTAAPMLVAAGSGANTQPLSRTEQGEMRWQALNQDLENRLNRLVIEHHEFGGRTGVNGPVPHIGLVSYGSR
jgi:sigma-E factor negative regulatory protein RseA